VKRVSWLAAAVGAMVVSVGVVAYAAIPDEAGVISACYQQPSGQLRVIDAAAGESCRRNELPLSWNQKGPKGDPGPASSSGTVPLGDVTLSDGETRVLLSEGALTLTAKCRLNVLLENVVNPVPRDQIAIVVSTTQDHSVFIDLASGGNSDFGPATPETERDIVASTSPGVPGFGGSSFSAAAPDGTRLSGVLNRGVNVLGRPGKCVFGGTLFIG
jgi:hypothetical protein